MFYPIHHIHQTSRPLSIYFDHYKIPLMEKLQLFSRDKKNHLEKFFAEKPERFWKDGIFKLPERWRKIVEQNGIYII